MNKNGDNECKFAIFVYFTLGSEDNFFRHIRTDYYDAVKENEVMLLVCFIVRMKLLMM